VLSKNGFGGGGEMFFSGKERKDFTKGGKEGKFFFLRRAELLFGSFGGGDGERRHFLIGLIRFHGPSLALTSFQWVASLWNTRRSS